MTGVAGVVCVIVMLGDLLVLSAIWTGRYDVETATDECRSREDDAITNSRHYRNTSNGEGSDERVEQ